MFYEEDNGLTGGSMGDDTSDDAEVETTATEEVESTEGGDDAAM